MPLHTMMVSVIPATNACTVRNSQDKNNNLGDDTITAACGFAARTRLGGPYFFACWSAVIGPKIV